MILNEKKTEEELQELKRFEALYKLPVLKGTSKQVPWGRDIRYRHLQYLDMIIDDIIKEHNLLEDKKPRLLECFCSVAYDDDASSQNSVPVPDYSKAEVIAAEDFPANIYAGLRVSLQNNIGIYQGGGCKYTIPYDGFISIVCLGKIHRLSTDVADSRGSFIVCITRDNHTNEIYNLRIPLSITDDRYSDQSFYPVRKGDILTFGAERNAPYFSLPDLYRIVLFPRYLENVE